jgi:hypothetical protein
MSDEEAERRSAATIASRKEDAAAGGLYYRVWLHLCRRGLTARSGDRTGLAAEVREILRGAQRHRRRQGT